MQKRMSVVVSLLLAMQCTEVGVAADCANLIQSYSCPDPSLYTPTTGGCDLDCRTYYDPPAASPRFIVGDTSGPCKNPSVSSFSVPYKLYVSVLPNCPVSCNYQASDQSTTCYTTGCEDYGC